jgi:hypothetical protein
MQPRPVECQRGPVDASCHEGARGVRGTPSRHN